MLKLFLLDLVCYKRKLIIYLSSRKFGVNYVGPLVIYKIVDPHNYLLMDIEGQLMRGLFKHERLKPTILHTDNGNVRTLSELMKVMNLALTIQNGPL